MRIMKRLRLFRPLGGAPAALALALAVPTSLKAQQSAPNPPEENILVEARLEQAIRNFVASMSDADRSRQLARWDREICPAVLGIDPAQADYMARRIGETAAMLRLRTGGRNCRPTMLVVVPPNAGGVALTLARNAPITLRTDGRTRLRRFVASTSPVRWLSVTNPCGDEGCGLPNSRLSRATHPEFQAMIVIVDAQQIAGFSLGEISDYVALVALGNPPLDGRRPSTSILAMFEQERVAGTRFALTEFDRAYLRGLYRTRADATGQEQRASIADRMEDEAESE